ncbi:hypothetical protein PQX77_013324 [Marasmius sp. AFHP31]|nr:hypothetical protein PQX77_013324 [Marasmius sp. AFHP31]
MSVENHIQNLQEAYNKVQALRQFPQALLKIPSSSLSLTKTTSLSSQYQQIKDISQSLKSEAIQDALRAAKASESANGLKGTVNLRRENRKRRRAPSPESPQPYVTPNNQGASLFPPPTGDEAALKACDLFDYIRRFNREHPHKLHIWKPTRTWGSPDVVDRPTTLRFCIKDIFTAHLTVDQSKDTTLITESVTVFGPREKPEEIAPFAVRLCSIPEHVTADDEDDTFTSASASSNVAGEWDASEGESRTNAKDTP